MSLILPCTPTYKKNKQKKTKKKLFLSLAFSYSSSLLSVLLSVDLPRLCVIQTVDLKIKNLDCGQNRKKKRKGNLCCLDSFDRVVCCTSFISNAMCNFVLWQWQCKRTPSHYLNDVIALKCCLDLLVPNQMIFNPAMCSQQEETCTNVKLFATMQGKIVAFGRELC